MFFLGEASNYSKKATFLHTFAFGLPSDAENLKNFLKDHYGAAKNHVALTNSGRSALTLALKASVPKNSKVLINAFTCQAVLMAVKAAGCVPIYADVDDSLNYSEKTLTSLLKKHPDLKALIIQNSLGYPVDIRPFEEIAKKKSLVLIEDLAHCTGVFYPDGREVGTVGDAAALSFGKGKSIDTITGGAVVLRNPTFPPLKEPKNRPKLSDSLRARWYPFLGACIRLAFRLKIEKFVLGGFLALHFIERSADTKLDLNTRPTYWQSKLALKQLQSLPKSGRKPLREFRFVKNREELLKRLRKNGYFFEEVWYDVPVSPARYYKNLHFPESECPNAVRISKEIINLPTIYPEKSLKPALKIIKEYEK